MRIRAIGFMTLALVTSVAAQERRQPPTPPPPATPGKPAVPPSRSPRAPQPAIWDLLPEDLSRDFHYDFPRWGEMHLLAPLPELPGIPPVPAIPPVFSDSWEWDSKLHFDEMKWEMQSKLEGRRFEIDQKMRSTQDELERRRFDMQHAFEDAGQKFQLLAPRIAGKPGSPIATLPPSPWRSEDQADSLYKSAREMLSRGEYRRAATMFNDIAAKHPNSVYAPDALYWHAYSLYRIGGTPELRGALEALQSQQSKYPNARTQADGRTLATRIRGALAARGDVAQANHLRGTAGDSLLRCDPEEQSVRVEALKAVAESDPEGAMPLLQRMLARTDECSASLRRNAVFIVGNKRRDAQGVALLSQVARNDPSVEVRGSALEWLARMPGDDALSTIEALARDTTDERIQRAAVRALVAHPSARARTLVRGVVERSDVPERLRIEALGAFTKERSSSEDVAWLRALYGRTENPRIKSRLVSALTRIGGTEVDAWLLTVARDPDEDSETRSYAMRRVAETQPIAELSKLYDAAAQRSVRETLIEALAKRSEAEATDKLIDIVKNGTDPNLRSRAISALTRKKDPRTMALLMELVSK